MLIALCGLGVLAYTTMVSIGGEKRSSASILRGGRQWHMGRRRTSGFDTPIPMVPRLLFPWHAC